MGEHSHKTIRRPRADAVRNRERVLEAAKAVFSAGGPDASLEAVARRAGVGIGTLYRHFPTREALFEAVYRREVEQLADLAEQLKSEASPAEALRRWLRSNVEFVATKKGMSAALALAANSSSELSAYSFERLTKAVGALLDRAVAAGEIRADISPEDLLRALVGMCYMHDQPGWQASVLRLVDVFVDGLCRPSSTTRPRCRSTQCRRGPVGEIRARNVIWCPTNHKHWHNASPPGAVAGRRSGLCAEMAVELRRLKNERLLVDVGYSHDCRTQKPPKTIDRTRTKLRPVGYASPPLPARASPPRRCRSRRPGGQFRQ